MTVAKWLKPSEAQIAEAEAMAAGIGDVPRWDGDVLCVGREQPAPPPSVPEAVTARQARLALLGAGLLGAVEQALSSLPGAQGEAARIEWEYALEIQRQSPLIGALAPVLGLASAQIDALFIAAREL